MAVIQPAVVLIAQDIVLRSSVKTRQCSANGNVQVRWSRSQKGVRRLVVIAENVMGRGLVPTIRSASIMHASRVRPLRRFVMLFAAICPRPMYRPAVHNPTANVLLVRMTPNVKTASCVSVSAVLSASVVVSRALYVQTTRNVLMTLTTVSYTHLTLPTTPYV